MIDPSDTLVILTINLILISPGFTVRTLNTSKPGDVTVSVITGDEGIPTERETTIVYCLNLVHLNFTFSGHNVINNPKISSISIDSCYSARV